jgi:hypothetical protein
MKDQEINIIIAEFCGWKYIEIFDDFGWIEGVPPNGDPPKLIPDFCNDLNEIQKAEYLLTTMQFDKYASILSPISCNVSRLVLAKAKEKAMALVKVIQG